MPIEYATRDEVNGLGTRVNQVERNIASLEEAMDTGKQDRRDIWAAVAAGREEDKRIERILAAEDKRIEGLVNQIALKVAGIVAASSILTTIAVALVVKYMTKG